MSPGFGNRTECAINEDMELGFCGEKSLVDSSQWDKREGGGGVGKLENGSLKDHEESLSLQELHAGFNCSPQK